MDKSSVPILYPQKTPENLTFLHYFHNASKMSGLKSVLFSIKFSFQFYLSEFQTLKFLKSGRNFESIYFLNNLKMATSSFFDYVNYRLVTF